MQRMQIAIDDARPGMVLAADVMIQGAPLLGKDLMLDDTLITLMRNCEITTLFVFDDHATTDAATAAAPLGTDSSGRAPIVPHPPHPSDAAPPPVIHPPAPDILHSNTTGGPAPPPIAAQSCTPPRISVTVSDDGMKARMVVEPADDSVAELDRTMLVHALAQRNIVFGIDEAALSALVDHWKQTKRRFEIDAAKGTPATPGEDGIWQMCLRHLDNRADRDALRACRRFGEAAAKLPAIDRAVAGGTIAKKIAGLPSVPGKNVFGMPIFTDATTTCETKPGENVDFSPDNQSVIARIDGVAYRIDDAIGVIPIDFNGSIEISITPDRMMAHCAVNPPGPGGTLPGKDELRHLLSDKGICSGILDADIETLMALCSRGAFPAEPFAVARGTPPVSGNNGSCTYHFNTQTSLSPAIGKDGHADFKSLNIVNSVSAGQELVSLIPPTAGSEGCDILGQILHPEPGIPAKLPQGAQTVVDAQDLGILRAATDGIVRCTGGLVEVCEGFVVPANVDFSIGNINYGKTVIVSGDVKAGFDVHCGGDLQVSGTIEDCRITVGGNVLCKYGFVGQGKGVIEAKGDVNIGFMKNQTVRGFKNVTIAKEALNSTILARGAVTVHGNPLSVAGGAIRARTSITVYAVGNHTGIRTQLETGVDFLVAEELAMIEDQYKIAQTHCQDFTEKLARFQKMIQGRKRLSSLEQKQLTDLAGAIRQSKQQLSVLDERKSIVAAKQYHFGDTFIRIEHAAYAGTLFKFGDRHYIVKEEMAGPKNIRYIDHEIMVL